MTTIVYDTDTSPEKRRVSPKLWGMIPDQGRGLVFLLLVLLGLFQTMTKVFSLALLATTNPRWLIVWLSVDYCLFFFYKIIRRDFVYYTPGLTGLLKYVIAFLMRLFVKLLADVAGYLVSRNAYELGGSYYSFNAVASQASCWVAAGLYVKYYKENESTKIDATTICVFIGCLQLMWTISSIIFFTKIKRNYWSTFYSTQSGRQFCTSQFLDNQDDPTKMKVFERHSDLWSDIKDDVKAFTLANWARWEAEKPTWFNDNFKALVPDEYIPKAALDDLNKRNGGKRRRSSVFAGGEVPNE